MDEQQMPFSSTASERSSPPLPLPCQTGTRALKILESLKTNSSKGITEYLPRNSTGLRPGGNTEPAFCKLFLDTPIALRRTFAFRFLPFLSSLVFVGAPNLSRFGWAIVGFWVLLAPPTCRAAAPEEHPFCAQGFVRQDALKPNGDVVSTDTFTFEFCRIDAQSWQLTWRAYLTNWQMSTTEHISFDGTNIFSVVYADKRFDQYMHAVPNTPFESNSHPARICRGPFPTDHSSTVGLIWLAFIGKDYLVDGINTNVPNLLVSSAREEVIGWACDCVAELDSNVISSSRLLRSAVFALSKRKLSSDFSSAFPELKEPDSDEERLRMDGQIDSLLKAEGGAAKSASFSLTDALVYKGRAVPTKFSGILHSSPWDPRGFYERIHWRAEVTNVFDGPKESRLPVLLGGIYVQDWRFKFRNNGAYLNYRSYSITDQNWTVSMNDNRLATWGKSEPRFNAVYAGAKFRSSRNVFVVLMVVVLFLPLILLKRLRPK
jgi:hypothetical protein